MIGMDQYELIRAASRVYGKSISAISREYGHSRKTIRKALAGFEPGVVLGTAAYMSPEQAS